MPGSPKKRARGGVKPPGNGSWPSFASPSDSEASDEQHAHTQDVVELRKAQAARQRALKEAAKLRSEKAYQDEILLLIPAMVRQDEKINEALSTMIDHVSRQSLSRDDVPLLKTLLAERKQLLDRMYGGATQRNKVESTSLNMSVDVSEMLRRDRDARDVFEGEVVDG